MSSTGRGSGRRTATAPREEAVAIEEMLGPKLRELRSQRGMTLADLAERSNLSRAFISQVERGKGSPSVASLLRLCEALETEIGALFPQSQAALIRASERPSVDFGSFSEMMLTPTREGRLQLIDMLIPPGGSSGNDPYSMDGDVEVVYVLRGRLLMKVGEDAFELEEGDALTFSPRAPHDWRNPSSRQATRAIWAVTPRCL